MVYIEESGVRFGGFDEECLFQIERSDIYKQMGEGIKNVEFIYLTREENVLFVVAKTSCPNADNRDDNENKQKKYEEYFTDVTDKFIDSLNMFVTTVLGRNGHSDDVSDRFFKKIHMLRMELSLYLLQQEQKKTGWVVLKQNLS